jgi:1-acyl-sn-glycerol-3-phosphate acyltransferase
MMTGADGSTTAGGARGRWPRIPAQADPAEQRISRLIRVIAWGCRVVVGSIARVHRHDLDRLPTSGAVILAPNHASNVDPVLIGAWMTKPLGRRVHWFAKREVLDWPVLGWIGRVGGIHGIERGTADVEGFRTALKVLEAGGVLLMFAEGTRSATGELQPGKDGMATLALRSGATIVPIGLAGTQRVWPKGGRPSLGHRIDVRVGEGFRPADVVPEGTDRRTAKALTTTAVMTRIAALLPPAQRGVYATPSPEATGQDG